MRFSHFMLLLTLTLGTGSSLLTPRAEANRMRKAGAPRPDKNAVRFGKAARDSKRPTASGTLHGPGPGDRQWNHVDPANSTLSHTTLVGKIVTRQDNKTWSLSGNLHSVDQSYSKSAGIPGYFERKTTFSRTISRIAKPGRSISDPVDGVLSTKREYMKPLTAHVSLTVRDGKDPGTTFYIFTDSSTFPTAQAGAVVAADGQILEVRSNLSESPSDGIQSQLALLSSRTDRSPSSAKLAGIAKALLAASDE